MNGFKFFWKQNWGLLCSLITLVFLLFVVWEFRGFVWPFIVGLIVAYLFIPLVDWVEKRLWWRRRFTRPKRVLSIVLSFAVVLSAGGVFASYIIRAFIGALTDIAFQAPALISQALEAVQSWIENSLLLMPEGYTGGVLINVEELVVSFMASTQDMLMGALQALPSTLGFVFGIVILPLILFFLVKDWHQFWDRLYQKIPEGGREHSRNLSNIIRFVLGGYIRAQGVLGIGVGIMVYIGLIIIGVPFAPALAGVAVLGEFIPVVGPWVSGAFAVVIALATVPDKAVWVIVLYVAANGIENSLLRPKIEGSFLKLHPAMVVFLVVIGSYAAGFWGLLLIVPLTATFVRIARYVRAALIHAQTQ